MTINVCMYPNKAALGIGCVVSAYQRHLPDFGIEFVDNENQADVVAVHAGSQSSANRTCAIATVCTPRLRWTRQMRTSQAMRK